MGEKKAEKQGKKVRKGRKHQSIKIKTLYQVKGDSAQRTRKACPRCGEGTWLARHKGREYCGRCGYTVFEKK